MTPWTCLFGHAADGSEVWQDISRGPHLLLAGTTGAGKSVAMHALIAGLVQAGTPQDTQILIGDVKKVEFGIWRTAPHVKLVTTERIKILAMLISAVEEMDKRYTSMERGGVVDIEEWHGTARQLPRMFVVIDEIADLTMSGRTRESKLFAANTLGCLTRVAQLGRAAGVHLLLGTQTPRADVLPGCLRANMPSRWVMRVRTRAESRIALDAPGAEQLGSAPGTSLLSWRGATGEFVQGLLVTRSDVVALVRELGSGSRVNPLHGRLDVHTVKRWVGTATAGVTGVVVLVGMMREGR